MKKIIALLISLVVLLSLAVGCASTNTGTSSSSSPSVAASPSAAANDSASASASASAQPSVVPSSVASASASASPQSTTREITDMAGRKVTIPTTVKTVYCAVPTAESMICSLCPEKMDAVVNKYTPDALKYLTPNIASLPAIGGWMGKQVTANIEDIVKMAPDVIIFMSDDIATQTDTVNQIQAKTGIPVIAASSEMKNTADAYRFLGDCLGVSARAELLASYCEKKIAEVTAAVANIPDSEKVTVYYAEGKGGLSTDPANSHHTEVLALDNVKNVADVEALSGQGMTTVSIEQVIGWNPSVILVSGSTLANYKEVLTNPSWKIIKAVQDGKVYVTPVLPFNWFDRPPNVVRLLGIQWFASVMYPTYYKVDINSNIKEYFKLFFNVDVTDSDIQAMLATPSTK